MPVVASPLESPVWPIQFRRPWADTESMDGTQETRSDAGAGFQGLAGPSRPALAAESPSTYRATEPEWWRRNVAEDVELGRRVCSWLTMADFLTEAL